MISDDDLIRAALLAAASAGPRDVPIGAVVAGPRAANIFQPGNHGTTFGGNPLATAAGLAVLETIRSEGLLEHVRAAGERAAKLLADLPEVAAVRAHGLWIGVDLAGPRGPVPDGGLAPAVVAAGLEAGWILNATGPDTLRLAPPLIIAAEELERFVELLPALVAAATTEGDPS